MATEASPGTTPLTALSSAAQVPYWDRDADQDLVCTDVRSETHDVKTFTFRAREGRYFGFTAGQYFSFDFDIGGQVLNRCYSVTTSALMPHSISVTVKRVVGGMVSNWLHDTLTPGTPVRAMGPNGRFKLDGHTHEKYLFISGGSGITPVMSMVRTLADARQYPDIVFFHASRTPEDLIFEDELRWRAKTTPNFRLFLLPERTSDGSTHTGITGRVNEALLAMAVPDLAQRRVMCCGPAPFMGAVRELSARLGLPTSQYYEESFGGEGASAISEPAPNVAPIAKAIIPATPPVASAPVLAESAVPTTSAPEGKTFEVKLVKQARAISVTSNENLLAAMRQAGLHIPSSCGEGECGTCKTKLVSGKVDMKHNGGIRQREIDAGFFLPCCSTPREDLVIDR